MQLEWDEPKRQDTLEILGLDFADAAAVFSGEFYTLEDDRREYGECGFKRLGY